MLHQVLPYCSPNASSCYESQAKDNHGCRVSCTRLYADVYKNHIRNLSSVPDEAEQGEELQDMFALLDQYKEYKRNFARNIKFDSSTNNLGMFNHEALV